MPFASLVADGEVQKLFTRYPRLQAQLRKIYQATLEPNQSASGPSDSRISASRYRGRGRGTNSRHDRDEIQRWTPERGFARGLYCIRSQQQSDRADANGLKDFSELVLSRCPPEGPNEVVPSGDVPLDI